MFVSSAFGGRPLFRFLCVEDGSNDDGPPSLVPLPPLDPPDIGAKDVSFGAEVGVVVAESAALETTAVAAPDIDELDEVARRSFCGREAEEGALPF